MDYRYREQQYDHGAYSTVSIYPVFKTGRKRGGRYRPTSDVQRVLNEKNAAERVARQMDANFAEGGSFVTLTYDCSHLPDTRAGMVRDFQNFIKRLKRMAGADVKYIAVPHGEPGAEGARLNLHLATDADLTPEQWERMWGKGIVEVSPLRFSRRGLRGLAGYFVKGMSWGRVMRSRNIVDPVAKERTGVRSRADVELLAVSWDDPTPYERMYPGYKVAAVEPFYNYFNKYYYIRIYLYKERAA